LHEIGHAIGLQHEHQSPECPLLWTDQQNLLLNAFRPWDMEKIRVNVTEKLSDRNVEWDGNVDFIEATPWDVNSIMHYEYPPSVIRGPPPYNVTGIVRALDRGGPGYFLSDADIRWAARAYPHPPRTDQFNAPNAAPPANLNRPQHSRKQLKKFLDIVPDPKNGRRAFLILAASTGLTSKDMESLRSPSDFLDSIEGLRDNNWITSGLHDLGINFDERQPQPLVPLNQPQLTRKQLKKLLDIVPHKTGRRAFQIIADHAGLAQKEVDGLRSPSDFLDSIEGLHDNNWVMMELVGLGIKLDA